MKKLLILAGVFLFALLCCYAQTGTAVIEDAKLGKAVKDRQIETEASEFALNEKVYLWVKVTGAAGENLDVTWKNGDRTYKSSMPVSGSPWRTWCYKTAALAGDWTVSIADAKGTVLKELSFKVGS
jgi:hypothetical protein